jgi:formamidase
VRKIAPSLSFDGARPLRDQPDCGHNRWHADLEPIASVKPGVEISFETGDAADAQLSMSSSHKDVAAGELGRAHPLTGPVYVEGAEPGDVLEAELVDLESGPWGWTALFPGFGFLADMFLDPFLVIWEIDGAYARSKNLPGVAIPAEIFPGTIGIAPSQADMARIRARESELKSRGGAVADDSPEQAYPPKCADGLRTIPPREVGGNMDIRQLTKGSKLFLPVSVAGALFSTGDVHFAQGEGEVCGTGVEICAVVTVRFRVHKTPNWKPRFPVFEAPRRQDRRSLGVTGMPITEDGRNESLDLTLSTRSALLGMIDYLTTSFGFDREAAYALCSAAVDFRISELVDVPNPIVTALLPLDIFEGETAVKAASVFERRAEP